MNILQDLNRPQKQAVCHQDGPLLVLAGPGSGKTRVITQRIAYLISQGVPSDRILALTFTNKAAQEMAHRVSQWTSNRCGTWVYTFHAFCARILRQECEVLGYTPHFTIFDTDDQKRALGKILDSMNVEATSKIADILHKISYYKNHCIAPDEIPDENNYMNKNIKKAYILYQDFLKKNNAMDFDDLLLKTLELFTHYKNVLHYYQEKFLYILVDEFQDTNRPQYLIARQLAAEHKNICATGDPDQSIYSWRGANIRNILNFEKDFPEAVVVRLEQNYRSTKYILEAASAVISHNKMRKEKTLWTEKKGGNLIKLVKSYDDNEEAEWICRDIQRLKKTRGTFNDMVVFYRMNAQSRAIETALRNQGIPYEIVGGTEFYQRAEIKDVLAYLRIMANESDEVSLLRILNVPPRGLGKNAISTLMQLAQEKNMTIMQVMRDKSLTREISKKGQTSLWAFVQMIDKFKNEKSLPLSKLIENLLQESGYMKYIQQKDVKKDEDRAENIQEFLASVREYEQRFTNLTLTEYLERISLMTDVDKWEKDKQEKVTMMTLHAAKGLEFPCVYIIGVTEGLLPHNRSLSDEQIEEERRLFFVGITRAKELLTLSYSKLSYRQGSFDFHNQPSRFLEEIPSEVCESANSNEKKQSFTPYVSRRW